MANTGNGAGRMLNSFTLSDGISQLEVASIQTSATDAVYKDKTDLVLTTNPGATMNFSAMSWTGSWMHAYVFVDYNKDKEFNQELNNGGTTTGEVVSYNAYNVSTTETEDWRDAKGQSVSAGCGVTNGNIPSWTLPANMAAGDYRLRFKIDWNSINACGDTDIKNNNGCIVDITLRIELPLVPTYNVTAVANDAAMGSVTSAMTEQDVYTMEATANEGYEFVNWTVAGAEVSTNATFTYTATADAEVVANFQIIAEWPATVEALATAEALIAQTGVGFPATTSAAYTALQSAIEAATAAPTIAQKAALDAAIPAYYAETEVTMPEAGKAYAMVAAVTPSQQFYVYNNSDVLGLADYTGAEFAEEAKFLCSIVDGKYVFQNVTNNKYFAYPTKTSVDWMTGVSNSGLEAELQDISKFEIFKLAVGANANVTATAEQLLGMVYMFGLRGYKSGVEEKGAIVVKNDKTFDGAGTPFCNGTFTSAIRLVEVEYTAPTPVYAVSAEAAPAEGGQVTISANEVEEGQTVELTATANEGYNFVNWTVNGAEVSTSESFTSEAITEATTFVANFVKKTFNVTVTAGKGGSVEPVASPVEYGATITLTATPDAGYEFVVWMVDGGEGAPQNPWTTVVTEDLDFEAIFGLIKQGDLDVTTDSKEETADASYTNVNVANGNVWDVQANTITADKVAVKVEADGTTPEIKIEDGGQITAVLEVSRVVEKEKWALMSLPFAVDLANVTVDGAPAVKDSNIKVLVYNASYRAANSVENWTKSGWVELTGTTIAPYQGFAVAVAIENGDEQTVTFKAASATYDGSDKEINLSRYASTVNGGADADWNFYGNPTLANASKGTGYSLYVYNAEDGSYDAYSGSQSATIQPYAAWFTQSADDFMKMVFSAGAAGAFADASEIFGKLEFSLNGEDEARILLVEDANEEYVRNEDALYFPAMNSKLSQLYLVKGNMKMTVSEQPALTSMAMGYKATQAGEQTLTMTSIPDNASVVLVDNVAGTETVMTLGDSYTFQSEAGTFNNRFTINASDLTGIAQATVDGDVKVVVNGDEIKVYGAEAGSEVSVITTNGQVVATALAEEGVTTLNTSVNGVIIVKVANTAVKVVK